MGFLGKMELSESSLGRDMGEWSGRRRVEYSSKEVLEVEAIASRIVAANEVASERGGQSVIRGDWGASLRLLGPWSMLASC